MKNVELLAIYVSRIRAFTRLLGDAIIPERYRKSIIEYLERASIEGVPYFLYGLAVYVIVLLALILDIVFLRTGFFSNTNFLIKLFLSMIIIPLLSIVISFIIIVIYKLYLDAKIYHKVGKMEDALPEFLSALSLNLKAGQSLPNAMQNSTDKEYGYLSDEIEKVVRKIRLGGDVDQAVRSFTEKYNSAILEETFELLVTSWRRGARTAQLVDKIFENLEVLRFLKNKIIASVTTYRIFLSFLALFIAPALFALSFQLINLLRSITSQVLEVSRDVTIPITINAIRVNDAHFIWFSSIALIIVASSVAIITSIVRTGSAKEGYKTVILYSAGTLISYQIFSFIFAKFFSLFNI